MNFECEKIVIPDTLKKYASLFSLVEMVNFNKIDFNKSITLTPRTTYNFETKWELKKLGELVDINPSRTELKDITDETIVSFIEMASVTDYGYISTIEKRKYREVKDGGYK